MVPTKFHRKRDRYRRTRTKSDVVVALVDLIGTGPMGLPGTKWGMGRRVDWMVLEEFSLNLV